MKSTPTLDEIGCRFGTDKASNGWHDYLRAYEQWFEPLRHEPIRLLEMGVLGGQSIQTWAEYFDHPETEIIGIDIELHRCQEIEDRRVMLQFVSQTDAVWWGGISREFDIIIDDASHMASQQFHAFKMGWPHIKAGGIYLIEDLHVFRSPQHCDAQMNILEFLNCLIHELIALGGPVAKAKDVQTDIASIHFGHGFAVIKKL